jgi:DNA-binding transcriptional LysR family regulator
LTLERYCEAQHLLVSIDGDLRGIVDKTLSKSGLTRNIACSVPLFFPALVTVAQTDLITTIPARLADQYAKRFALEVMEPPLKLRSFMLSAIWHHRTDSDPALKWLREKLQGILA